MIFSCKHKIICCYCNYQFSSVIRQKGESQTDISKKIPKKTTKQSMPTEKRTFIASLMCIRTCAYQGVRNVCFLENVACFVFFKYPFWSSLFCLITDVLIHNKKCKSGRKICCEMVIKWSLKAFLFIDLVQVCL